MTILVMEMVDEDVKDSFDLIILAMKKIKIAIPTSMRYPIIK